MKIIRIVLGKIILAYEALFSPKGPKRDADDQRKIDAQTSRLALYQFNACPFCVKVRFAIKRLGLKIELRDAKTNDIYRQELTEKGGKLQVPCLKIQKEDGEVEWMYESDEIIRYLRERFA